MTDIEKIFEDFYRHDGCTGGAECIIGSNPSKWCAACQEDHKQRQAELCALCGNVAVGHAMKDGKRYCHDDGSGISCYMKSSDWIFMDGEDSPDLHLRCNDKIAAAIQRAEISERGWNKAIQLRDEALEAGKSIKKDRDRLLEAVRYYENALNRIVDGEGYNAYSIALEAMTA